MIASSSTADAVVIGGGFYGAVIAAYLARERGVKRVIVLERESALMTRASFNNQARVHNGCHYPRSFTTAYRSRVNLPRFVRDWPLAVRQDFSQLYAIARRNSKVTAQQFARFCHSIGAPIERAEPMISALFEPRLVEAVFKVQEYAFDSTVLARWAADELARCGVEVRYNVVAQQVTRTVEGALRVVAGEGQASIDTQYVFNCTYSGLRQFSASFPDGLTGLKHEITEMALLQVPEALRAVGVTVMDGPFFSMMPFPSRGLHTLSHVRYTPHLSWLDCQGVNPYARLEAYPKVSRVDRMLRDVGRYMPSVLHATTVASLFEVKTVLLKNEGDDGRPILFERYSDLPGCFSVLGGKVDNIYDVLELLDNEPL